MERTSAKTGIGRRTICATSLAELSHRMQYNTPTTQQLQLLNNVVDEDWKRFCAKLRSGPFGKAVPYWSVPREA
eukprot:1450096-Heterocapsa_arctica.AAC.1